MGRGGGEVNGTGRKTKHQVRPGSGAGKCWGAAAGKPLVLAVSSELKPHILVSGRCCLTCTRVKTPSSSERREYAEGPWREWVPPPGWGGEWGLRAAPGSFQSHPCPQPSARRDGRGEGGSSEEAEPSGPTAGSRLGEASTTSGGHQEKRRGSLLPIQLV